MFEIKSARQLALRAAETAGNLALANFDKPKDIRFKGRSNPVTNVDIEAEEAIVKLIEESFPEHNILTEEVKTTDRGSEFTWVIDPLDGTMNYSSGIPIFSTSVALARSDTPILGVVFDPIRKDLFVAEKGKGAYLNGKRILASSKRSLSQANIGLDLGYQETSRLRGLETMLDLRLVAQSFRLIGSAVLGSCYAACGKFDLYFHPSLYAWDLAASTIIAKEAGAVVTEISGQEVTINSRNFVVSNAELHAQFLSKVGPKLSRE